VELFFSKRFRPHRLVGFTYLIVYALCWLWIIFNDESFLNSHYAFLSCVLPILGVVQTCIAIATFTFLPKSTGGSQNYFSSAHAMTYDFVKENLFFAGLLLFQWVYYTNDYFALIKQKNVLAILFENLLTFFPYAFLRDFFPKTSFGKSAEQNERESLFLHLMTRMTRIFYMFAKHYVGYYFNYIRFLDAVGDEERYYVYLMLMFGTTATTISMFLQTLKFKKYISPHWAMGLYVVSYLAMFYPIMKMMYIFVLLPEVTVLTALGIAFNYMFRDNQGVYQIIMFVALNLVRYQSFIDANLFPFSFPMTVPVPALSAR